MTDDGIQQVLEEIRAVASELVELRENVAKATQHFGDVDALQIDVEAIKKHLVKIDEKIVKIDEILAGPPTLENLAVKQEKDRKTAHRETAEAEGKQETVNVGFREKISELFGITGGLQQASLRLFGILALGGAVVIYILARALGA